MAVYLAFRSNITTCRTVDLSRRARRFYKVSKNTQNNLIYFKSNFYCGALQFALWSFKNTCLHVGEQTPYTYCISTFSLHVRLLRI